MTESTSLAQKEMAAANGPERTRGGSFFTPRVDILEDEKQLTLFADVPGVTPEDIELRYEKGELLLHGKVRPRERVGRPLLLEYEEGDFYRVFNISETIDNSRIEASCKNGVLIVHLPKVERAQPRQIAIKAQ